MLDYEIILMFKDNNSVSLNKYETEEQYNDELKSIFTILSDKDNDYIKLHDIITHKDNICFVMGHKTPITLS